MRCRDKWRSSSIITQRGAFTLSSPVGERHLALAACVCSRAAVQLANVWSSCGSNGWRPANRQPFDAVVKISAPWLTSTQIFMYIELMFLQRADGRLGSLIFHLQSTWKLVAVQEFEILMIRFSLLCVHLDFCFSSIISFPPLFSLSFLVFF